MLNGTYLIFKNFLNTHCRFFSLGILTLASSVVFSTSLIAGQTTVDQHNAGCSKCRCIDGQKGPQGDTGPAGPAGENSFGGLEDYASFQLITSTSTTQIPAGSAIPFGTLVAGTAGPDDAISPVASDNSMFNLEPGDYKIAVGVSTFGILGTQLEITLNGNPVYNWPLNPTVNPGTTFIELTFMIEITGQQSLLEFSVNNTIPSTPILDLNTLQNYLSIEKIF